MWPPFECTPGGGQPGPLFVHSPNFSWPFTTGRVGILAGLGQLQLECGCRYRSDFNPNHHYLHGPLLVAQLLLPALFDLCVLPHKKEISSSSRTKSENCGTPLQSLRLERTPKTVIPTKLTRLSASPYKSATPRTFIVFGRNSARNDSTLLSVGLGVFASARQ